ncbi:MULTISPECIES: hypothetical protein [unclassified Micromonospora]|uniref:hypothetical protein n=1 Tax=unclassified Micromonospora TaxID=2617518 RepID=UPI0033193EBC
MTWTNGLVRLTEKNGGVRWQPITLDLAEHLYEHANTRGAGQPTGRLLRYRNGRPISSRRYDHLWKRIGERLPWVAAQGISTHWLRHTTLSWVERHFGYGVARAYAGHTDSPGSFTTTYIKADLNDVAVALSAMTGQPHPLAVAGETSVAPVTRIPGLSRERGGDVAECRHQARDFCSAHPAWAVACDRAKICFGAGAFGLGLVSAASDVELLATTPGSGGFCHYRRSS